MTDLELLRTARREVTEEQIAYRDAVRYERIVRAEAELRVIEEAGGDPKSLGANERDRERTMTLMLAKDLDYVDATTAVVAAQTALDRAADTLETLLDERREREWLIRDQLRIALDVRDAAAPLLTDAEIASISF